MQFIDKIDNHLCGWPKVLFWIAAEIIIVCILSHIPFILDALDVPPDPKIPKTFWENFAENFVKILNEKANEKGENLIFVSALVAPVVFWSMKENKTDLMKKILCLCSFLLMIFCAYLHGKQGNFVQTTSLTFYVLALLVWMFSILAKELPPRSDPPSERKEVDAITHHLESIGAGNE
jgi:hypothetical protein